MNLGFMGKAGAVASNDKKQQVSSHTFEPLHEMYDTPPGEHYFSNTTTCHDHLNNIEPLHTTYSYCKRFRSRVDAGSDNFVGANECEKFFATNKSREEAKVFKDYSSSATAGNNNAKANKSLTPRKVQAANTLISCKVVSCNGFKKSLHRQSDVKKVIPHVVPSLQTTHCLAAGNVRSIVTGKSSDIAATALPINKSLQQKGSHHKVKCRTGKLRRNQTRVMQSTANDMATTVTANVKASMKLPNTPLTPATESTKSQHSASSANTLAPTTTSTAAALSSSSSLSNLTQTLLDMPVIPQAWQQFVKLLQNSVSGLTTTTSRVSTTNVRKTTKNIRNISRHDETSTISGAALIAAGNATAAVRCKATAQVMHASMHSSGSSSLRTKFRLLPSLGATSFFTLLTLICLETVLLSTVSNCAKTFYMHWNTSNSIFRIDNTDHIIDVNKGNLAFEFDQVHIICPVYEPGTFENETEKYIIYNVSKVEYETCRITNATPRVIAICDKPQKLMFFTITFRPFTPQPGGLEFLPGNDYYFISTSSKDDLYRRIGGRCSTNNMKVVFKVCCAPEEKNKTAVSSSSSSTSGGSASAGGNIIGINSADGGGLATGLDNAANVDVVSTQSNINQHQHMNNINTIGINGVNTGLIPIGGVNMGGVGNSGVGVNNGGMQMKPLNGGSGTSINTNIDQFNRIPIQAGGINVMGNNVGGVGGVSLGGHGGGGIMLTPGGQGGINMISGGVGIGIGQYPGHPGQTGIRINNVASQQHHATHKNNNNNGKDTGTSGVGVSVDGGGGGGGDGGNGGTLMNINFGDAQFLPPFINTNHSNIVQSTINWPAWGRSGPIHSKNNNLTATTRNEHNINDQNNNYYSPSHRTINNKTIYKNEHYDKHPNEVVKNEELTYHSGATSLKPWTPWTPISTVTSWIVCHIYGWLKQQNMTTKVTRVTTVPTTATSVPTTARTVPTTGIQFLTSLRAETDSSPATQSQSENSVLQLLRQCFVKFKYLIFDYHVSITSCMFVIAAVIIYLLQFVQQQLMYMQAKKATQLELSSGPAAISYLQNVLVPHTFHAKVTPKFQFIYLIAPLQTFSKATVGLISLLADQVAARNASNALSTKQHFSVRRQANQQFTANTCVLQNSSLPTAQNCRSQISSVSVKVKRFR